MFEGTRLRVYAAPASYILTMKLLSGRYIDKYDIPALMRAPGCDREKTFTGWWSRLTRVDSSPPPPGFLIDEVWERHERGSDQTGRGRGSVEA